MTGATATDGRTTPRGTAVQRARAGLVRGLAALLERLPGGVVDGLCDVGGEIWYRAAPGRAAAARGNLAHVVDVLAARGAGGRRVRAAARDADALERLVRAVFRHATRSYAETLRGPAADREAFARLVLETPEAMEAALATGPAVFSTLHFGSMQVMASFVAAGSRVPVTGPMETLTDPELQRVILQLRLRSGAHLVDLAGARRPLRAALARGEAVGVVGDRVLGASGGVMVPFFGLPALLPIGPAYLALDSGAPLHVGAIWRAAGGGFRGRVVTLGHPPADVPLRPRIEALLAAQAEVFEDLVAVAPEQWWSVFYPIWDSVGPMSREGARRRQGVGAAA